MFDAQNARIFLLPIQKQLRTCLMKHQRKYIPLNRKSLRKKLLKEMSQILKKSKKKPGKNLKSWDLNWTLNQLKKLRKKPQQKINLLKRNSICLI